MSSTNHNDNYKTVIVELAVYVDEDNYYHKGLNAEGIVEKELSAVENETGIYLERIIYDDSKKTLESCNDTSLNSSHEKGKKSCH
tara:strand:+ start:221 stop:475 length:255 start_codon:yes stop_codon:yes gene_type:complete